MKARERAYVAWQLDQPRQTLACGCVFLLGHDRLIERKVRACERHRVAYTVVRPK